MNAFTDFHERVPKDKTAILIKNQELGIEIFCVFNKVHNMIITDTFLVIKPNRHLEWRYATEIEMLINAGFKPEINK